MEFIIKQDLEKELPEKIEANFAEMKSELAEKLTKYNTLVVTEDGVKDAKSDRAKLNKLKEAIENRRKEVKKQCLAPYEAFEKEVKEVVALIDKPIIAIDTQIKTFDEQKQNEKWAAIERFFNDNIKELSGLVPLDKIVNPKWRNVGESLISITQDMISKIEKINNDLRIIGAFHSEYDTQIKDTYLQSYDMSAALAEKTRLEEQAKKLAEMERSQQAAERPQDTPVEDVEVIPEVVNLPILVHPSSSDGIKTIKVIFHNTTAEFRTEMRKLVDKHNIKYGGIK